MQMRFRFKLQHATAGKKYDNFRYHHNVIDYGLRDKGSRLSDCEARMYARDQMKVNQYNVMTA